MKLHVVKRLTCFLKNDKIDSFHYDMFHGYASRDVRGHERDAYFLGDRLEHKLNLCLNLFRINDIIEPTGTLLVTEPVKSVLAAFQEVEFLRANLRLVRNIPFMEGDFSHWNDPEYRDDGEENTPIRILLEGDDERYQFSALPTYYEVICANLHRLLDKYDNWQAMNCDFGLPTNSVQVPLNRLVVEKYPIFYFGGAHIIREDIFVLLKDFFNWTYFVSVEVQSP